MNQTLEATFDGQFFRPLETVDLEPDTKVEFVVTVKVLPEEKPKSFLRTAHSLKLKSPKDFSLNLDDHLYGGAKLDDE